MSSPSNSRPLIHLPNPPLAQFGAFEFDAVFDEAAAQADIFRGSVQPLLNQVYQGLDTMVFTYGYPGWYLRGAYLLCIRDGKRSGMHSCTLTLL